MTNYYGEAQAYSHRCPYCGQNTRLVWVHGHGQCEFCKTNVDECCRGEDKSCTMQPEQSDLEKN